TDAMVDVLEPDGGRMPVFVLPRHETRNEQTRVVLSFDECVDGVAVCANCGEDDPPLLVLQHFGFAHGPTTPTGSFLERSRGIVHPEGDVPHAVTVPLHMLSDESLRGEARGEHESDLVLYQQIAGSIARTRFWSAVAHQLEPERGLIEMRRLPCVPDVKLDVVGAVDRQKVLCRLAFGGDVRHRLRHPSTSSGSASGSQLTRGRSARDR